LTRTNLKEFLADIIHEMFYLWHLAEEDLLSETVGYELKDTGQGMQRVQPAPRTYRAMQGVLRSVQHKVNQWVGSSVIHMGGTYGDCLLINNDSSVI